ncbi:hypothetical protein SAMN02787118_105131 [Streptomyces mirabilis]|jgi:hypothetical protein|uniref:Uncharacterized protein n=1 Tax=Streptomyces mirabilis TaxID=68239 RepID=A0A1I2HII5_9ACTN|nr:hypothetical protein SAMN02787118_105131 [Streptomyces mirabilis]
MRIATPPIPQEMIAAGPAAARAPWAPNSQPEPMIDPSEAQISPMNPTSHLRPGGPACVAGAASVVPMTLTPAPKRTNIAIWRY